MQAIGRFRNGVARAYHIANTSDNLQCLTREALERRLTGEENIYNQIRQIQPDGEDEAQARFQALNGMAYKRFVTRDGNATISCGTMRGRMNKLKHIIAIRPR